MTTIKTAIVKPAYDPEGRCGWDVLIRHSDGTLDWADRLPTRDAARESAQVFNDEQRKLDRLRRTENAMRNVRTASKAREARHG